MSVFHHSQNTSVREDSELEKNQIGLKDVGFHICRDRPLLMAVTQEGAVVRGVGLSGQPQEQCLREAQRQGELTPQLPHAVQQQQEDRRLLLKTGMGVG